MLSERSNMPRLVRMLTLRPGSQAHRLITMLSLVGEYPVRSLGLIGNERTMRELVHRLTLPEEIRNPETGAHLTTKLFQLSGKGRDKSVRLYKGALPILNWLHPDAYRYYMNAFYDHHFPGDASHRERNHRVAESVAVSMAAGIEPRAYLLPSLQNWQIAKVVPEYPNFYLARDVKKVGVSEQNKTMFTRTVGTLFYPGGCYAVYNTRSAVMKWNGMGEFKAKHSLIETARLNAGIQELDSAILLGRGEYIALRTLEETEKNRKLELRFDGIYRHIHFIPMNENGIRLLKILTVPDWNEKLLSLLFDPETRSYNQGYMEYDAFVDGKYVYAHLDGDIARLMRFREALSPQTESPEVLCFPFQVPLLRTYLGERVNLKTIAMDAVENELLSGGE